MIIQDDRTPEQKETHRHLVIGTDSFMSGWGGAADGLSYAAWACEAKDLDACFERIEGRGDMDRVRFVIENGRRYRPNPMYCAHLHIYVWRG